MASVCSMCTRSQFQKRLCNPRYSIYSFFINPSKFFFSNCAIIYNLHYQKSNNALCQFFSKNHHIATGSRSQILQQEPFNLFSGLHNIAPVFYLRGEQIVILDNPKEFYEELKSRILSAKRRIFLAALYIGPTEKELVGFPCKKNSGCGIPTVNTIREALKKSSQLNVHILVDYLRSTRVELQGDGESSVTLLSPLVEEFPDQVTVSLYHTPNLTGILKQVMPSRINEGIGLMHIKAFGFDDDLILSGANLSHDYFTNRQDRYMIVKSVPAITDYFAELLQTIGKFSYTLSLNTIQNKFNINCFDVPDPITNSKVFKKRSSYMMKEFINKWIDFTRKHQNEIDTEFDTIIFPVTQMAPLNIRQDERATLCVLDSIEKNGRQKMNENDLWTVIFSSGYFNFSKRYKEKILDTNAKFRLLAAAPEANGFFRSKGISKYIPPAYTLFEKQFYDEVRQRGKEDIIKIMEYNRPAWTFHAKGLWCYTNGETRPSLTMIGSPNYGYRSTERDLEAEIIIITKNASLKEDLHRESSRLSEHTEAVNAETFQRPERKVPYLIRVATSIIKTML
ncbi:5097_t:CDS:2 [Ambispora gerdemannii]|uniref:CDP-diacylglycerol--glycerol-3-phosphate 3-phosphatidyltransferase n=1 Tax=Ambispora gerdemannii TaxID=144530 RepID=A0A9N9BTW2_9GLOM|nr:5097_t:CDS:2 [Ambispora gerdemannii]